MFLSNKECNNNAWTQLIDLFNFLDKEGNSIGQFCLTGMAYCPECEKNTLQQWCISIGCNLESLSEPINRL